MVVVVPDIVVPDKSVVVIDQEVSKSAFEADKIDAKSTCSSRGHIARGCSPKTFWAYRLDGIDI